MSISIIYLVSGAGNLRAAKKDILRRKKQTNNLLVVALDSIALDAMPTDISRFAGEFLELGFPLRLDLARQFSRQWYRSGEVDYSLWEAFSTAEIAEMDFFRYFIHLLEDVDTMQNLVRRETPCQIRLYTGDNERYTKILKAIDANIEVVKVSSNLQTIRRYFSTGYWKNWLKLRCLDRWVSFQLTRFISLLHLLRRRKVSERPAVVILEMVVPSIFETLMAVVDKMDKTAIIILASDPRAFMRLLRDSLNLTVPAQGDDRDSRRAYRQSRQFFPQQFRILDEDPPCLNYIGTDIWPIARQKFKDFFRYEAAHTVRELCCIRTLAREQGWAVTVSASCLHHFGRLCVELSRSKQVPSITIQHGVVASPTYLPVISTKLAVWGEMVKDWFIATGVPADKLVVTGQPRFDRMIRNIPTLEQHSDKSRKVVLIATQPLGWPFQQRLLETLSKVSRHFAGDKFILKPHPDEPMAPYRRYLLEQNLSNVTLERGNLTEVLATADVVMVHSSTVGIEALILEKPLIVFNPFNWPEEVPYVSSKAALQVSGAEDLIASLGSLLYDESSRKMRVEQAKGFIDGYLNFGGHSAARICELVESLM